MAVSPQPTEQASAAHQALSERLQDPGVAAALTSLLDHLDLVALLVEGLDQMVSRSEVISDSLIAGLTELRGAVETTEDRAGVDPQGVVRAGLSLASVLPKAAPGMVAAAESGAIERILGSDLVSTQAVSQIEILARGFTRGSAQFDRAPVDVGGPVSLVKLFRDPDINRALRYFATVAKSIGQELAAPGQPTAERKDR